LAQSAKFHLILRGGICLPSDLLCFIKVQNLFIQFGLSFAWSLSGGRKCNVDTLPN
jgi:hypothetical protein